MVVAIGARKGPFLLYELFTINPILYTVVFILQDQDDRTRKWSNCSAEKALFIQYLTSRRMGEQVGQLQPGNICALWLDLQLAAR